jgi:hypothetical protein
MVSVFIADEVDFTEGALAELGYYGIFFEVEFFELVILRLLLGLGRWWLDWGSCCC